MSEKTEDFVTLDWDTFSALARVWFYENATTTEYPGSYMDDKKTVARWVYRVLFREDMPEEVETP